MRSLHRRIRSRSLARSADICRIRTCCTIPIAISFAIYYPPDSGIVRPAVHDHEPGRCAVVCAAARAHRRAIRVDLASDRARERELVADVVGVRRGPGVLLAQRGDVAQPAPVDRWYRVERSGAGEPARAGSRALASGRAIHPREAGVLGAHRCVSARDELLPDRDLFRPKRGRHQLDGRSECTARPPRVRTAQRPRLPVDLSLPRSERRRLRVVLRRAARRQRVHFATASALSPTWTSFAA